MASRWLEKGFGYFIKEIENSFCAPVYCDRNMNDDFSTGKIPENVGLRFVLKLRNFPVEKTSSRSYDGKETLK